jgi:WD40 repeat protein
MSPKSLCALAGLLQLATSRSILPRADVEDGVLVPILKSDFQKDGVPAQWAPGYPKAWGAEEFRLEYNKPRPDDIFFASITDDEKYAVLNNASHTVFIDIDTKETVSTIDMEAGGAGLRKLPDGGYDLLSGLNVQRVDSDLQPVGEVRKYGGDGIGNVGAVTKDGRIATTGGYIFDLDATNTTGLRLENPSSGYLSMSFSKDGEYLSAAGFSVKDADIFNGTSGHKILTLPPTNAQNWAILPLVTRTASS